MQIAGPWWSQLTSASDLMLSVTWIIAGVEKRYWQVPPQEGAWVHHRKPSQVAINIRRHAWTSASRSTWMKICQHHSTSLKVHDPGYQMQLPLCLGLGQMLLRPVVADRVWMSWGGHHAEPHAECHWLARRWVERATGSIKDPAERTWNFHWDSRVGGWWSDPVTKVFKKQCFDIYHDF